MFVWILPQTNQQHSSAILKHADFSLQDFFFFVFLTEETQCRTINKIISVVKRLLPVIHFICLNPRGFCLLRTYCDCISYSINPPPTPNELPSCDFFTVISTIFKLHLHLPQCCQTSFCKTHLLFTLCGRMDGWKDKTNCIYLVHLSCMASLLPKKIKCNWLDLNNIFYYVKRKSK